MKIPALLAFGPTEIPRPYQLIFLRINGIQHLCIGPAILACEDDATTVSIDAIEFGECITAHEAVSLVSKPPADSHHKAN
jgi:hypothetical protein